MTDIYWKNANDSLCIVCKANLNPGYYICNKCQKICQVIHTEYSKEVIDIKSICCNSDVEIHSKITCSNYCHEKFIIKMLQEHGLFKKIIDTTTGKQYKIPTRVIIEDGLRQQDLKNYPLW